MKKGFTKIAVLLFVLWNLPQLGFAAAQKSSGDPQFFNTLFLYMLAAAVIAVVLLVVNSMIKAFHTVLHQREVEMYKEQGLEHLLAERSQKESWWNRFYKKMTDAVPVKNEKDIMLDHNYDGIRELDNNLPPWWLYGFYLTIGIAIFYIGFYHFSAYAKSSTEIYEMEMAQAKEEVNKFLATQKDNIDENNLEKLTDPQALEVGKKIFDANCVTCHLESGGGSPGSVGPNLTDEYWLHGGGIKNVFSTIKYGVPEKGMIAWKDQLRPTDMHKVASYVISLQGTNPENAKEPQGKKYVPETE